LPAERIERRRQRVGIARAFATKPDHRLRWAVSALAVSVQAAISSLAGLQAQRTYRHLFIS
jgi:ABC-type oligopeptide transport system ATPase subunit